MKKINYTTFIIGLIISEYYFINLFSNNTLWTILFESLLVMISYGIVCLIITLPAYSMIIQDKDKAYPFVLSLIDKKNYFTYKGKEYFTAVDKDKVEIYTDKFFLHCYVGYFYDTENKKDYQGQLTGRIDYYVKMDLEIRLKNKYKKNKYKDFNQVEL